MINQLEINNFKSIQSLKLNCKRVNVFIGEPNSGKSNILEALALQSQNAFGKELNKDIIRYRTIGNLFYDSNINNPIEVKTDEKVTILEYAIREDGVIENNFNFTIDKEQNKEHPIICIMTAKFYARVLTTALMFIFINSRVLKSSRNPGCPICQYPLEKTYLLCFCQIQS